MSELLLKNHEPDGDGLVHQVTPESAGWGHVGFELWQLEPGMVVEQTTGGREACLVLLGGRADVVAGRQRFAAIGQRRGPFDNEMPFSVYVPHGTDWSLTAITKVELAVCTAPGGGGHPVRLIPPGEVAYSRRGTGSNTRHVHDILPETAPANALLVVEVVTPSGSWSSYPSHKHDRDALPEESQLEETYYHRFNPPQGFGFQRVYTDDRSLDVAMTIEDGDVTLIPRGYHPCATAHGYDLYYLNVMAGPKRAWKFNTEPAHRWLLT